MDRRPSSLRSINQLNDPRLLGSAWVALALILFATTPVFAADVISIWNGTTDNWSSSNWANTPSVPHFPSNGNGGLTYDVVVNSGTITLDQDISIQGLAFGGGTISGSSNLTLNDSSTWTVGTMSGSGQTTIGSGGTLSMSGGSVHALNRLLVNNGSTTWTGVYLEMNGGTFQNNGSFTANSNEELYNYGVGSGGVFNNAGTFTKLGAGRAQFYYSTGSMVFNNTGLVDIQAGDLLLESGTHTGDFSIAAGSTLQLGGNESFSDTSDITGAGTVNVYGGTITFNGQLAASAVTISSGAMLKGTGTLQANVTNAGRLAPGNSPGIITIDGDFTQTSTSSLEIEVGGLTPGTEHDKVIVTGHASLDGRYEFPIINNFEPQLNDEITFLTANSISGVPSGVFAPNLGSVNPNLGFVVIKNSQDLRLRFVTPTDVHFVDNSGLTTQDWNQASKWDTNAVPTTSDRVELTRSQAPFVERVEVTTADAVTHQVAVHDQSSPITIAVENGRTLAAAVGDITIGENATIELGTAGNPMDAGTLATPSSGSVLLEDGGMLSGNGTIAAGELIVSTGTLNPGFSVGHIDVQGDYEQQAGGTILIDVEGTEANEFDTLEVSGSAQLGGSLVFDASNYVAEGTATEDFEIITAGDLSGSFDSVEWSGNDDLYFFPDYDYSAGTVRIVQGTRGDMNGDGLIDQLDVDLFVFILLSGSEFKFLQKAIELCDANERFCEFPSSQAGGDWSGSGIVDFEDIPQFQNVAAGSGMGAEAFDAAVARYFNPPPSVPEPSRLLLLCCGLVLLLVRNWRNCNRRSCEAAKLKYVSLPIGGARCAQMSNPPRRHMPRPPL